MKLGLELVLTLIMVCLSGCPSVGGKIGVFYLPVKSIDEHQALTQEDGKFETKVERKY